MGPAVATICLIAATNGPALAQHPMKIGVIASMTGPLAPFGAEVQRSLDLARSSLAKNVEFVTRDDQSNPALAVANAQQLAGQEKVQAVIGPLIAPAQREVARAIGTIPLISLSAVPLTRQDRPENFFRLRVTRGNAASVAADFVSARFAGRKVAVIGDANARLSNPSTGWKSFLGKAAPAFEELSVTDQALQRLKSSSPDLIFSDDPRPASLAAIRQALPQAVVVTYTVTSVDSYREIRSERLFVAAPVKFPTDAARRLYSDYAARTGSEPTQGLMLPLITAVQVLQVALSTKDAVSRMKEGKFETAAGAIRFSRTNGDAVGTGLGATVWRSDNAQPAQEGTGVTACKCKETDCCKTECCEKNGCDAAANKCVDVSCSNS